MPKPFRAVPVGQAVPGAEVRITAETDFDAFEQAKQALGSQTHFDLWDGQRRALCYRPSDDAVPKGGDPT